MTNKVTETEFTLPPIITKKQTRYMKQWFIRHRTSSNKGQWCLKDDRQKINEVSSMIDLGYYLKSFLGQSTGKNPSGAQRKFSELRRQSWESRLEFTGESAREERERILEICREPLLIFSWVMIRACKQENCAKPGKDPLKKVTRNSAYHSHQPRNNTCFH